jgi:hypothetical protein
MLFALSEFPQRAIERQEVFSLSQLNERNGRIAQIEFPFH